MLRKIVLLSFFVALLSPLESTAQQPMTLQQCISYALDHSITARQAELNTKLAKSKMVQGYAQMLPSLNGQATNNYSYGRTIDPFTNTFVDQRTLSNSFGLSSSFTIFNGMQLQNFRRQNSFDYMAGKKDEEKTKNDLVLMVVNLYLQVLFAGENLVFARDNSDATREQLERTRFLVDAGSLPEGSRFELEAQAASDDLRVVNAESQLELATLSLTQAMNLDSTASFKIVKPDLDKFPFGIVDIQPGDIFTAAVRNQPDISSAEFKVKSAGAGLAMARGTRSPRLTLTGSYGTGYSDARLRVKGYEDPQPVLFGSINGAPIYYTPERGNPIYEKTPFNTQLNENLNKFIGFNLTVPVFNGLQSKSGIDRAKINFANSELQLQQQRNQLYKNIEQAHADATAALRKLNATQRQVASMQESFNYAEKKFDLGAVTALDFLVAKNNLSKATSDLLQARYDYIFKSKIIDFYLGKPLIFE